MYYQMCKMSSVRGGPKKNTNPLSCYGQASQYLSLFLGVVNWEEIWSLWSERGRNICKLFFIFKVFIQKHILKFLITYLLFISTSVFSVLFLMLESKIYHSLLMRMWFMKMLEWKEKLWVSTSCFYYLLKLFFSQHHSQHISIMFFHSLLWWI